MATDKQNNFNNNIHFTQNKLTTTQNFVINYEHRRGWGNPYIKKNSNSHNNPPPERERERAIKA